jgi:hypothetical protein
VESNGGVDAEQLQKAFERGEILRLPEVRVEAKGPWVLVMVEKKKQLSKVIEIVEDEKYDRDSELGVGWVLSASTSYVDKGKSNETPVKRGDKIGFRRFLRSEGLMQPDVEVDTDNDVFFLHVRDINGIFDE